MSPLVSPLPYLHLSTESVIGSLKSVLPQVPPTHFLSFSQSISLGPPSTDAKVRTTYLDHLLHRIYQQVIIGSNHPITATDAHYPEPGEIFHGTRTPLLWYGHGAADELILRYLGHHAYLMKKPLVVIRCPKYPGYMHPVELIELMPQIRTLTYDELASLHHEWLELTRSQCVVYVWDPLLQKVRGVPDDFFDADIIQLALKTQYKTAAHIVGEVLGKSPYTYGFDTDYLFHRILSLVEAGIFEGKLNASPTHLSMLMVRRSQKSR